ncbi:MAG: serine/threonine protein kinase [gamma proteobacterium symbiont of Lucinoma myriamae]|nr:serine/threonine protein kinase [gamma proteobacterium symbiont of Lucinoma myriamae]
MTKQHPDNKKPHQASINQTQAGYYNAQTEVITHEADSNDTIKQTHPYPFLKPAENAGDIGRIAHYQISETLGQGGTGYVFKAYDSQLHRTVALKVMKPELSHQLNAKARFLHEARSMASINNDNVAIIHQVGEEGNIPYLAMEFLEGQSMDSWIKSHPSTPTETIIKWGIQICQGLIPAHKKNLIHRDIKPANLWVEAPDERIKLLDFGLAYALDANDQFTQTGYILGTLEYMSPEQIEAGHVNARSDLYSLGCVLYQLASHSSPFSGSSQLSVLKNIATITPLPLQQVRPDIPKTLSLLISQLLCRSPDARPASAHEVCLRLKKIALQIDEAMEDESLKMVSKQQRSARTISDPSSKKRANSLVFSIILIAALSSFAFIKQTSTDIVVPNSKTEILISHSDNSKLKKESHEEQNLPDEITASDDDLSYEDITIDNEADDSLLQEPVEVFRPTRYEARIPFDENQAPYPQKMPPPPEHRRRPFPPPRLYDKDGRPVRPPPPPRPRR